MNMNMTRQTMAIAAMLILGFIAVGTGSVLLIGYAIAALSFGAIVYVGIRKLTKRVLNSPVVLRRSVLPRRAESRPEEAATRRAA
jgi:hypothetical protein